MLKFYYAPWSRASGVLYLLQELGVDYETVEIDIRQDGGLPEAYRKVQPNKKVPAIEHDGVVITERGAITTYLADAFPDAGLAPPAGDRLRGPYYRWMFFAAGPLEMAATNKAFGFEVPAERKGMAGYGSLADVLSVLEAALSRSAYLVGDRFTAADLYVGAHIGWGMSFGTLENRPAFERYVELVSTRPAAIRAREIDDALVADNRPASG